MSGKGQEIDSIITFVAEDYSHGFVKVVPSFSALNRKYIYNKKIESYRFIPDKDAEPEVNQLIRIRTSARKKDAQVLVNTYPGIKKTDERIMPIGKVMTKDQATVFVKNKKNEAWTEIKIGDLVDYFLYFDPQNEVLLAQETEALSPSNEVLKSIEETLVEACSDFKETNKRNLGWLIKHLSSSPNLVSLIQREGRKLLSSIFNENQRTQEKYIALFGQFGSSVLDVSSAKKLYGDDVKLLIDAWIENVFPQDFISLPHLITFHDEFNLRVSFPATSFEKLFSQLSTTDAKEKFLEALLSNGDIKDEELFGVLIKVVKDQKLSNKFNDRLVSSENSETILKLWRADKIELSIPQIKSHSSTFNTSDLKSILQRFEGTDLIEIISNFQISSLPVFDLISEKVIDPILKEINYCIFDTEVNPKNDKIDEYAWISNEEEFEELDINEETLNVLQNKLMSSKLVIGHNIESFDYKYVFNEELRPESTWDTLKIEVFLDPTKASYALNTDHEALQDCSNTKRLFLFQLCRLRSIYSQQSNISNILPNVGDVIDQLPEINLTEALISKFNDTVFRVGNSLVADKISDSVPKGTKLVVTPKAYWSCFVNQDNYFFKDEEDNELNLVLSAQEVKNKLAGNNYLQSSVERYLGLCQISGQRSFARKLSTYLVSAIEDVVSIDQLCTCQTMDSMDFVVSPHYYVSNREKLLATYKVPEICFLGVDQWKYESQKLVKNLTTEELEEHQEAKELWVHFSNGSSMTQISKELVNDLNNDVSLEANYWLEKYSLDQYNLMSSIPTIEEITKGKVFTAVNFDFQIDNENLDNKLFFFKARINRGRKLELNPETLYRDIYWNERLQLVVKLLNAKKQLVNKRVVLVVQKKNEITVLQRILKDLKLYCPSEHAGIQRRLELLEDSHKGVLVCDYNDLEKILLCSSNEPITILLESLRPNELLVHSGRSNQEVISDVDNSDKNEEVYEEDKNSRSEDQELPHMGSAVKKLPSLHDYYDWLSFKIRVHNEDNQFATIDPRAAKSTFSRINVERILVDIENEADAKSKVSKVISSRTNKLLHVPKEFKLGEIDAHLARISAIFLKGKGDGKFLESQREYLDYIMPADQDVLVTLPTGTGKSVLFQGPSLYRSSYTGKLSIVVTPLKALMEDHVYGLWKLGFWNSVEYINSDKGLEVQDLYRRIAGGELLMVFVTPERFRSRGFIRAINQRLEFDGSFEYIVFDEAHCISQWGSEFRPDYFYCAKQIRNIRKTYDSPILLLSATVTKQVAKSIETVLYE